MTAPTDTSAASYTFVTRWRFAVPVHRVWDEISRPLLWPTWRSSYELSIQSYDHAGKQDEVRLGFTVQ
ncbi:MAG: hypothetical protein U1E76_22980 [Planctomycetota bacterium]